MNLRFILLDKSIILSSVSLMIRLDLIYRDWKSFHRPPNQLTRFDSLLSYLVRLPAFFSVVWKSSLTQGALYNGVVKWYDSCAEKAVIHSASRFYEFPKRKIINKMPRDWAACVLASSDTKLFKDDGLLSNINRTELNQRRYQHRFLSVLTVFAFI